jgi:hypothetical protein
VDFRSGQNLAWENKVAKGFNTTDVPLEFCLLQGEVAEAFDAWRGLRFAQPGHEVRGGHFTVSSSVILGLVVDGPVTDLMSMKPDLEEYWRRHKSAFKEAFA